MPTSIAVSQRFVRKIDDLVQHPETVLFCDVQPRSRHLVFLSSIHSYSLWNGALFLQDKHFFEKYLSGLVGEVFGEEVMDKTKPDFYMVNFLRDDIFDEDGCLVEEGPKVREK